MKLKVAMAAISAQSRTAEDRLLTVSAATQLQRYRPRQACTVASPRAGYERCRLEYVDYRSRNAGPRVRSLDVFRVRSGNYGEAAPGSNCCCERQIAGPMDVLVHAGEPNERCTAIRDGTDDASCSRMPVVDFARKHRSHREARGRMP